MENHWISFEFFSFIFFMDFRLENFKIAKVFSP